MSEHTVTELEAAARAKAEEMSYGRAHGGAFVKGFVAACLGLSESYNPYTRKLWQQRGFRNAWTTGHCYGQDHSYDEARKK